MTFWDAYYALMAFVATIPVIVAFQVGALLMFAWSVFVLLGENDPAGTAEQETERQSLEAGWAADEQDLALAHADLSSERGLKRIGSDLQEFSTLLARGGFLGEG